MPLELIFEADSLRCDPFLVLALYNQNLEILAILGHFWFHKHFSC